MNNFITLKAWIANGGDGSASICWFLPGQGPDVEADFETWSGNEGQGATVEVRHGGPEHLEAWIEANAFKSEYGPETFVRADSELVESYKQLGWPETPTSSKEYVQFHPPTGWENT